MKCRLHTIKRGYYTYDELLQLFFEGEITEWWPLDDTEFIPQDYGWEVEECGEHFYEE